MSEAQLTSTRGIPLLPAHKLAYVVRPIGAALLQVVHRVAHYAQLLRPLLNLPLHVRPVPFIRLARIRGGGGRSRPASISACLPALLPFRTRLGNHAFGGWPAGPADQHVHVGRGDVLCAGDPLHRADGRARRDEGFGVEELVLTAPHVQRLSRAPDGEECEF